MGYDGLTMTAALWDLQNHLTGARIQAIYQPGPRTLVIHTYRRGHDAKTILSAHNRFNRIQRTSRDYPHPQTPPAFCMLLRKQLRGGKITGIEQDRLERVAGLRIQTWNGQRHQQRILVIETMGRHSNIILLDDGVTDGAVPSKPETRAHKSLNPFTGFTIIDSIKRVTRSMSRYRQILPGHAYKGPPEQGKVNLLQWDESQFQMRWSNQQGPLWRRLLSSLMGVGPVKARSLCREAGLDPDREPGIIDPPGELLDALTTLRGQLERRKPEPSLIENQDTSFEPQAFHAFRLVLPDNSSNHVKSYDSVPDLLDRVYKTLEEEAAIETLQHRLKTAVETRQGRLSNRLDRQEQALNEAQMAETYKKYGELLTAALHEIEPGQAEATVTDWYQDQQPLTIPLDSQKTPQANANTYFDQARKARRTKKQAKKQLRLIEHELAFLEEIDLHIEQAENLNDLQQIEQTLIDQQVLDPDPKEQAGKTRDRKQPKPSESGPIRYRTTDGLTVWAGRHSRQNDDIRRRANADDLWLHVSGYPGAHVILRLTQLNPAPDDLDQLPASVVEAAEIAAFHSKARQGRHVQVDYTFVKHVSKAKGAAPGQVYYRSHRSIQVTPDRKRVLDRRINP